MTKLIATLLPGVQHLQNIHPMMVHFPIAFLSGAVLLYVLAGVLRSEKFASAGLFLLILGTVGAAVAVATGLYAAPGVMVSFSVRDKLLEPHEDLMLTVLGISVVLSVWALISRPFPRKARPLFILTLFVLMAVMTVGADYGVRMVYDYNAGGNACPQPIEYAK